MNLSLAQQVAQMVVVRASGYLFDPQIRYPVWEPPTKRLQYWIQDLGVGGVLFVDGSAVELAVRTQQVQEWAQFPLLLAADIEEGVGQRFAGATWFPPPLAIGAQALSHPDKARDFARKMAAITAHEALAIGLNWVLAPVVDVNNNPDNPVINVRAFGETPDVVSQLTSAFIQGCQSYPVLTTAKHFPGHGDTAMDSHLELPRLSHSAQRLADIELPPFQAAIAAGVDTVMGAHLLIPAWDQNYPATLSHSILTTQLRQNLGFEGLIVTDALVMGAIANHYTPQEAAILAVEAGADILLMPLDAEVTIQAVCEAVKTGRISAERIQASVERIWQAKAKIYPDWKPDESFSVMPFYKGTPASLVQTLASASAQAIADKIVQDSLQTGGAVPIQLSSLSPSQKRQNIVIVDDLLNCRFLDQHTPAITRPAQLGYELRLIDHHSEPLEFICVEGTSALLQLFIRGNPFRSSAGLTQMAQTLVKNLLKNHQLHAITIYGSPYALDQFRSEIPSNLPYVFSYSQTPAAQGIVLEALFQTQS